MTTLNGDQCATVNRAMGPTGVHSSSRRWSSLRRYAVGVVTFQCRALERPELPGDVVAAQHAKYFAADLPLDHRAPRDEAEAEAVIDHGKAAARKLSRTEELAANTVAVRDLPEGKASFDSELVADRPTSCCISVPGRLALMRSVPFPCAVRGRRTSIGALRHGPVHLGADVDVGNAAAVAGQEGGGQARTRHRS